MDNSPSNALSEEERKRLIELIPEVGDLDPYKENIRPRRNGRSVAALTTLFERTASERQVKLEEGHLYFQELIDNIDEQDDPLQIYVDYIRWTIEMYPEGHTIESNLIGLLKEATNRFVTDRRYKNDPRYLKIWMEYAQLITDPRDIFLYLIKHDVGQSLALFYEEYAAYYEKLNKIDHATEVFKLGINQEADPLKRLKRNFGLFKARVQEKQERGMIKQPQMEARIQMESLRATGHRTMLGHKSDSNSRISLPSNIYAGTSEATRLGQGSSRSRSSSNSRLESSTPFSVFVDTSPSQVSILPTSPSESTTLHLTEPSFARRENQKPVEKLAGATLPQASIPQRPIEKFQVYQDPPEPTRNRVERADMPGLTISTTTGESSLAKIRRHPTADIQIKRKPPPVIEVDQQLINRFDYSCNFYLSSQNSKGEKEYIAVRIEQKEEMSFEEVRAKRIQHVEQIIASRLERKGKERERQVDLENSIAKRSRMDSTSEFIRHNQSLEADQPVPELTAETLAAMDAVDALYGKHQQDYTNDEDLTWTNEFQRFEKIYRPPVNENE
ncbi:Mad3/BUB1 homology region 1-domain-containing protein [Cokeromyces recurvatus]|uniref:Mad3/BUB1 homology region 1-domain-containing protein n=1 Tax=Cokeromyces recurvatus TaxID=90255 RepID=UPI00221F853A|nr:Mad3/BUB1 homology region 1-domain-containing protein [Cokeromyces recurvatus]KAI7903648.1 Mad3/BUB1 homology region 1-domain-containing protein [Cokeromyces recurvatus]